MPKKSAHTEWLSLVEVTEPFLSIPTLDAVLPEGPRKVEPVIAREVKDQYESWIEDGEGSASLDEWFSIVLERVLHLGPDILRTEAGTIAGGHERSHGLKPAGMLHDNGDDHPRLLVLATRADQSLDEPPRGGHSADTVHDHAVRESRTRKCRLVLLSNGAQWRLIDAEPGRAPGYITWQAEHWIQERVTLSAFQSLLERKRFFGVPDDQAVEGILDDSLEHQEEITEQLGKQVLEAVTFLIRALDRADRQRKRELLAAVTPQRLYEASLTVMMRLVFLLSAEERKLLPTDNEFYNENYAVGPMRAQLERERELHGEGVLERRFAAWARLIALFRGVYAGIHHEQFQLWALGGSLFDPDRFPFLEGRPADSSWRADWARMLPVDDRTVLHMLRALQLLRSGQSREFTDARTLSYHALDVEQIGYVYEGLLDHTAARVDEVSLVFKGKSDEPISLDELEAKHRESLDAVVEHLNDHVGGGKKTIRKDLVTEPDEGMLEELELVCGGDRALAERVLPYARRLDRDLWNRPVILLPESFVVIEGDERRASGTHYTPVTLTEAIVRETLEPVVYRGPAEGWDRSEWELKSAPELLDLKVCDPAMGSGAFLVQACRYLAARLVEAWNRGDQAAEPPPDDPAEKLTYARRLVSERCLYGVDKNHMAVELAKLSLWLTTLAKNRPFGYLDHALQTGDSLLGVIRVDQIVSFHLNPDRGEELHAGIFDQSDEIRKGVFEAIALRNKIRDHRILDLTDVREMQSLDANARRATERASSIADAIIAAEISPNGPTDTILSTRYSELGYVLENWTEKSEQFRRSVSRDLDAGLPLGALPRRPMHWPLAYPEVFAREHGGFDAIVGNPPFKGGQYISGELGSSYRDYLVNVVAKGARGSADLVTYFFLRAAILLSDSGYAGLLATKTIAEGDTREVGLDRMVERGVTIYRAYPREPWPGKASVVTSRIHFTKVSWDGILTISGRPVSVISPGLADETYSSPEPLLENKGLAFMGSTVVGQGFVLQPEEARQMLEADPKNRDVVLPYMDGEDINSHPRQQPSRYVICFWDWPEERARQYEVPYERVRQDVLPERLSLEDNSTNRERKRNWWRFERERRALYHAAGRGHLFEKHPKNWDPNQRAPNTVIAICRVSSTLAFARVRNDVIWSEQTIVFALEDPASFAVLQSGVHVEFAWQTSSRHGEGLRYVPTDSFVTFPFPRVSELASLREAGLFLDACRTDLCLSRNIGLTEAFGLVNDPDKEDEDIRRIRDALVQLDEAVLESYSWTDLALQHGFHEIANRPRRSKVRFGMSESARREVLQRLSALNHERYETEHRW